MFRRSDWIGTATSAFILCRPTTRANAAFTTGEPTPRRADCSHRARTLLPCRSQVLSIFRPSRWPSCILRPVSASSRISASCGGATRAMSPSIRTIGRSSGRMPRSRASRSARCGRWPTLPCPRLTTKSPCSAMRARRASSRDLPLRTGMPAPSSGGALGPVSPRLARRAHPEFAPAPEVVDTTAAGDSFNGGYLAAFLRGEDERRCLLAGHKIASRVVGASGALIARS